MRGALAVMVATAAAVLIGSAAGQVDGATASTIRHVDCQAASSGADGSTQHPFASLAAINSGPALGPGDRVLLKRGTYCDGTLAPVGAGSEAQPVTIGPYGEGSERPKITATGEDAVRLENTSHFTLTDLELTNPGDGSSRRRGVHLLATGQTVAGIVLSNLDIHDIGGSLDKDFGGSGGIQVDATGPGAGRFNGLLIASNRIENVSRSGIFIAGTSGSSHPAVGQPWPQGSSGVRITGNSVDRTAGDGIVPTGTIGAVVDHNVVSNGNLAGEPLSHVPVVCNAGIWAFNATDTVIEHNEVFGMRFNGCDGSGFDIDYDQDGTVVQFNFSHNNEGGFMLLCTDDEPRTAAVRFNLSLDDGFMFNTSPCKSAPGNYNGIEIYNNTVVAPDPGLAFLGSPTSSFVSGNGPPQINFFNNLVVATGNGRGFDCEPDCHDNLFWGIAPTGNAYLVADPKFVAGDHRGTPDTPAGFRLGAHSPARGAAAPIPTSVSSDYFGAPIKPSRAPSIGFDQSLPPDTAPKLTGFRLEPRRFRARPGRGASIGRRGSRLRFRLDSAAKVTFKVSRAGHGKGTRTLGSFTVSGRRGSNARRFTGRLHHLPLGPGSYRLGAVARSAGGRSDQRHRRFRIIG